jgi:hypothetical protein
MIKLSCLSLNPKSPILIVGLFCLWLLVGCSKPTNPDDVTIAFWTALAENNLERAKYYSTEESVQFFDKKLRNASLQIGKIKYDCDGATVETQITRQTADASSSFKTFLIRDLQEDRWKVDYPRTLENIDSVSDKNFKNIVATTKDKVKKDFWSVVKDLGNLIIDVFENHQDKQPNQY